MSEPYLVFSTASYSYLGEDLCRRGGAEPGAVERKRFPDGERYLRIGARCAHRDAVLVGGTISDDDTLEIFDLACGLVQRGVRSLTLAIPFFGYSTMEREVKSGDVVTAKTRARLLSAIPRASRGNRLILIDLHTAGITYYFEGDVHATHLRATPVITPAVRRLGGEGFVIGCTDAGRAKWVESLANELGVSAAFAYKRRTDERTEVTGVSARVEGTRVVLYDDMIRTGGSLLGAARAYREAGAASLAAVATHGVFPGDALERLRESGLLDLVVTTDTHPRARELAGDFLQVESIAPVLADRLEDWP